MIIWSHFAPELSFKSHSLLNTPINALWISILGTSEKLQTANFTEDIATACLKCLLCMCTLETTLGEYYIRCN